MLHPLFWINLPCAAATAMVTLGIAGATINENCSFVAAKREGDMPAAVSAALILKNHVYSLSWLSPYNETSLIICILIIVFINYLTSRD